MGDQQPEHAAEPFSSESTPVPDALAAQNPAEGLHFLVYFRYLSYYQT
jgi:hypothetical protein